MDNNDYSSKSSNPVSMGQAFKLFWKNYVNFSGKSSRSEYWWWYLWNLIITFVICIPMFSSIPTLLSELSGNAAPGSALSMVGSSMISMVLLFFYGLGSLLPNIAILVRRLRDTGIPEGAVISLVVARYVLIVLGLAVHFLALINFIVGIAILIISILPSKPQK